MWGLQTLYAILALLVSPGVGSGDYFKPQIFKNPGKFGPWVVATREAIQ